MLPCIFPLFLLLLYAPVSCLKTDMQYTSNLEIIDSFLDEIDMRIYVAVKNKVIILHAQNMSLINEFITRPLISNICYENNTCSENQKAYNIIRTFKMIPDPVTVKVNESMSIARRKLLICSDNFGSCSFYNRRTMSRYNPGKYSGILLKNRPHGSKLIVDRCGGDYCIMLIQTKSWHDHNKKDKKEQDSLPNKIIYPLIRSISRNGQEINEFASKLMCSSQVDIRVISVFLYNDFYYMVYVFTSISGFPTTRIARFCRYVGFSFVNYIDIPLRLSSSSKVYNRATSVTLNRSKGKILNRFLNIPDIPPFTDTNDLLYIASTMSENIEPKNDDPSAITIIKMSKIHDQINTVFKKCFQGIGVNGIPFYSTIGMKIINCVDFPNYKSQDNEHCYPNAKTLKLNNFIMSPHALEEQVFAEFSTSSPKKHEMAYPTKLDIVTTLKGEHTILYSGNVDGRVSKILVEENAFIFDTFSPSIGYPISVNSRIYKDYFYAMSGYKISFIKLVNCRRHVDCKNCLVDAGSCGWCSRTQTCTQRKHCSTSSMLPWFNFRNDRCATIVSVSPSVNQMPFGDRVTKLRLTCKDAYIRTDVKLQCVFSRLNPQGPPNTNILRYTLAEPDGGAVGKNDQLQNIDIKCKLPRSNLLPRIRLFTNSVEVKVTLKVGNLSLIASQITLYDCQSHKECSKCVTSSFKCTWCLSSHTCGNPMDVCQNKLQKGTHSNIKYQCPHFVPMTNISKFYLPSGPRNNIALRLINTLPHMKNIRLSLTLNDEHIYPVKLSNSNILTAEVSLVNMKMKKSNVTLKVLFDMMGVTHSLDNLNSVFGIFYHCNDLASFCGTCQEIDKQLKCSWCTPKVTKKTLSYGKSLLIKKQKGCYIESKCLVNKQTYMCDHPIIDKFSPQYGPLNGQTTLIIHGNNLGSKEDNISVKIGDLSCVITKYISSKMITCAIEKCKFKSLKSFPVVLKVNNSTIKSKNNYEFVQPTILKFTPNSGIIAGGTSVTIHGNYLDSGSKANVTINSVSSIIERREKNKLLITTGKYENVNNVRAKVFIDEYEVMHNFRFNVRPNPTVVTMDRNGKAFRCGSKLMFSGFDFMSTQTSKLTIKYEGMEETYKCKYISKRTLACEIGDIDVMFLKNRKHAPLVKKLPSGERMDAPTISVRYTLSINNYKINVVDSYLRLGIYEAPVIDQFKDKLFELVDNELILLKGYFEPFLRKSDFNITINGIQCLVDQLKRREISCKIESYHNFEMNENYKLEVRMPNFSPLYLASPGFIRKTREIVPAFKASLQNLPKYLIAVVAASGAVLICIICIVTAAYRRKSKQNERDRKNDEAKLNRLEASVVKECKEAFAELQTEMNLQTTQGIGEPPYISYQSSCNKILFPHVGLTTYNQMHDFRNINVIHALDEFDRLLRNKTFLLLFVRALESCDNFTMRQRVDVASLISVILQRHMYYYTDILKILLSDLIEKNMVGQSPKLFLRRTESVAEKMLSNWFTFLLHSFIKDTVGKPLYTLFRAIKVQIDKGPVDHVSSDARYSLSEDKLLRQHIDYKAINVVVKDLNNHSHRVNVLTCDTITQVKDKILDAVYMNEPYSNWPEVESIDLDWRTGERGVLTLMDFDITTDTSDNEQRKLNTLSHYHVTDEALLILVGKKSLPTHSTLSLHSRFHSSNSCNNSSPLLPRSFANNTTEKRKSYHLIKIKEIENERREGHKMMSEIYLTRLLTMKGILQGYVDDIFKVIFSEKRSRIPKAVKYIFDFLDDQARYWQITDDDVVYTWKSNGLPLRFWVSIIKNPDFIFDVNKSNTVDSSLSVVAQTFMDSCSLSIQTLSKDSPSNKLLYAKEIPKYKTLVDNYYKNVQEMTEIDEREMKEYLDNISQKTQDTFDRSDALLKLYQYVTEYEDKIMQSLEEDEFAIDKNIINSLKKVTNLLRN